MPNRLPIRFFHSRGFTLLEIMVAVFILGLVFSTVYAVFSGTLSTVRELDDDARAYAMARITLDHMSRDLSSLQRFQDAFYLRGENVQIGKRDFASLSFWSAAHLSYERDGEGGQPAEIRYTVREDREGGFALWRSDIPQARPSLDQKATGGVIICERLQTMRLTFYDESGQKEDTWDSTTSLDRQKGKPPVMVAIELILENKRDAEKPHRFAFCH